MLYTMPFIKKKVIYALLRTFSSVREAAIELDLNVEYLRRCLTVYTGRKFPLEFVLLNFLARHNIPREYSDFLIKEAYYICARSLLTTDRGVKLTDRNEIEAFKKQYADWERDDFPSGFIRFNMMSKIPITHVIFMNHYDPRWSVREVTNIAHRKYRARLRGRVCA